MSVEQETNVLRIARSVNQYKDEREFILEVMDFADKVIVYLYVDGEIDCSIDIQLPSSITEALVEDQEEELESKIRANFIVGGMENMKMLILATQLGKLLVKFHKNDRPIILNASSKIFGRSDEPTDGDFNLLMFILGAMKDLIAA